MPISSWKIAAFIVNSSSMWPTAFKKRSYYESWTWSMSHQRVWHVPLFKKDFFNKQYLELQIIAFKFKWFILVCIQILWGSNDNGEAGWLENKFWKWHFSTRSEPTLIAHRKDWNLHGGKTEADAEDIFSRTDMPGLSCALGTVSDVIQLWYCNASGPEFWNITR